MITKEFESQVMVLSTKRQHVKVDVIANLALNDIIAIERISWFVCLLLSL